MNKPRPGSPVQTSELLLYTSPSGAVRVGVLVRDETAWLTQRSLSELFGVGVPAIAKHLKNIFESGELEQSSVLSILETTAADGKVYSTQWYHLDAVIAVGYRVNSYEATRFRVWATGVLREFIVKGFVLDDDRLKQGRSVFGRDYFDDLLERIREIRSSERRFYQKVTDIYALAADYDANAALTAEFFATVQNKLHWAITGQTAAERIVAAADASKPNMGLTTWKHAPDGKILKADAAIAKNYLSESELGELNRLVSAYLDLAENRAERGILMRMADWTVFLNRFLELSDYPVLADKGKVTALEAKLKAEMEFETFRKLQDATYTSDFDRVVAESRRLAVDQTKATAPASAKRRGRTKP